MRALGFGCGLATPVRAGPAAAGGVAFDFAGGTMPAGATVRRASPATRWTAARMVVEVAADTARFDHDPHTGDLRGLLIEEARTNLIPRHDDATIGWSNAATTGAGAAAPSGGASQRFAVPGGGFGPYLQVDMPVAAGERITLSAHIRSDAAQLQGIGTNGVGNGGNNIGRVIAVGPVWTRFEHVVACAPDSGLYALPFTLHSFSGAGDKPDRIADLWGVQLERGGEASSLIPTRGAAAARAADRLLLDLARFGHGDGPVGLRVTYDDGSAQEVAATVAGGTVELTRAGAALARTRLRSIAIR